mmetsp:Transcript_18120/g.25402  ORF Transcript_18120/g.25402 Transcript_18120/m.25402 type:complete len:90 (+) Transcript_18120:821-1090(+)
MRRLLGRIGYAGRKIMVVRSKRISTETATSLNIQKRKNGKHLVNNIFHSGREANILSDSVAVVIPKIKVSNPKKMCLNVEKELVASSYM